MTWNEFKSLIDSKLEQEGKDGNTEVDYIDFGCNYLHKTYVFIDDAGIRVEG